MPMVVPASARGADERLSRFIQTRDRMALRAGMLSTVTKGSAAGFAPVKHGGAGRRHKSAQPAMQKTNVLQRAEGLWFGLLPC